MRSISEINKQLSEAYYRQPIAKVEIDASGLSEEERAALLRLFFKEFAIDGGSNSDEGFLFSTYNDSDVNYTNSAQGVVSYDVLEDGRLAVLGIIDGGEGGWYSRIKILDSTDVGSWSWDGAYDSSSIFGVAPKSCSMWRLDGSGSGFGVLVSQPSPKVGIQNFPICMEKIDSTIYIGGCFLTAFGIDVNGIISFSPDNDEPHLVGGAGISGGDLPQLGNPYGDSAIFAMAKSNDGRYIYVGGCFAYIGDLLCNSVARYDTVTNTWSSLGRGLIYDSGETKQLGRVYSIVVDDDDNVYFGGLFTHIVSLTGEGGRTRTKERTNESSNPSYYIAVWNNEVDDWFIPTDLASYCFNGKVTKLVKRESDGRIFACGEFTHYWSPPDSFYPPDVPPPAPPLDELVGLAYRDGIEDTWHPVYYGVGYPYGYPISIYATDTDLYVISETYVHKLDFGTLTWTELAQTSKGKFVECTYIDGKFIVVGDFGDINSDSDLRYTAYYDGTWNQMTLSWPAYPMYWWQPHPKIYGVYAVSGSEVYILGVADADYGRPYDDGSGIFVWDGVDSFESVGPLQSKKSIMYLEYYINDGHLEVNRQKFSEAEGFIEIFSKIRPNRDNTDIDDCVLGLAYTTKGRKRIYKIIYDAVSDSLDLSYYTDLDIYNVYHESPYSPHDVSAGVLLDNGQAVILTSGTSNPNASISYDSVDIKYFLFDNVANLGDLSLRSSGVLKRVKYGVNYLDVDVLDDNTLLILLDYDDEYYIDSTGLSNNRYRFMALSSIDNINLANGISYFTRYGGYGEDTNLPGIYSFIVDSTIYTNGGLGYLAGEPYGRCLIKTLVVYDLLTISDHIQRISLSHNGTGTSAQLSLTVLNEFGVYDNTNLFRLGAIITLYLGFVDENGESHYDRIGDYEIISVSNNVEFGKKVIEIECSDLLNFINRTQFADASNPFISYISQIITDVPMYTVNDSTKSVSPSNPFTSKLIVSNCGYWQFIGNSSDPVNESRIKAANTNDAGSSSDPTNPAKQPMLYTATAGASVSNCEAFVSCFWETNGTCGGIGIIIAGNPSNVMDDSLMVVIRPSGDSTTVSLARTINRGTSIAPLGSRDDFFYQTISRQTVTLGNLRNAWYDFIVRKTGDRIDVYYKHELVKKYTKASTFYYSFNPTWYVDARYRGVMGLFAAPFRTNAASGRVVYMKKIYFYSLDKNFSATDITSDLLSRCTASLPADRKLVAYPEYRFYDDFSSASLSNDRWFNYSGATIVSDSLSGSGYALKLSSNGSVFSYIEGYNRHFIVRARIESVNGGIIFKLRRDIENGSEGYHQYLCRVVRSSSNTLVTIYKQTASNTFTELYTRTIDTLVLGSGYYDFTVSASGPHISIWCNNTLLATFKYLFISGNVENYSYNVTNRNIKFYYGFGGYNSNIYISKIYNSALDTIISGLEGVIGFTVNPGDYYGQRISDIIEASSGLYYVSGSRFIYGLLVPDEDKVSVFSDEPPYEFEDNMFKFSDSISMENWYTAVQTIGGDGKFGPLVVDQSYHGFSNDRIFYNFAEGVTDVTKLYDLGELKLKELTRNRYSENFSGFGNIGIELRDRVNIIVHQIPHDKSSDLSVDISRLVDGYELIYERSENGVNLSMDVKLIEG